MYLYKYIYFFALIFLISRIFHDVNLATQYEQFTWRRHVVSENVYYQFIFPVIITDACHSLRIGFCISRFHYNVVIYFSIIKIVFSLLITLWLRRATQNDSRLHEWHFNISSSETNFQIIKFIWVMKLVYDDNPRGTNSLLFLSLELYFFSQTL